VADGEPYDGVIGFSEGAALAAALLLTDAAKERRGSKPMFRYAVFFNAVNILSPSEGLGKEMAEIEMRKALETFDTEAYSKGDHFIDRVRIMSSDAMSAAITIPTLHVVGLKDDFREFSRDLIKQCTLSNSRVVELPIGHELPRGRALEAVALQIEEALLTVSLSA
jgi:pimeloyl-ACP methyl ester carboxylesterase